MATQVSYVRFLRGTPAAYQRVVEKDPDTLYFISEKNATSGDLYLGNKLISGKGALSIEDLKDIVINGAVDQNSILVYDADTGNWVNKPASEIFTEIASVMTGASETEDGIAGIVPQPKAGDQKKFLRGDGTWADGAEILGEDFSGLKATVATLVGPDSGKSVRQIATSVLAEELIPDNADESLDTLKEIADWIQSHPSDASSFNSRITTLETSVNGDGTAAKPGLIKTVGNLSLSLKALQDDLDDLALDVEENSLNITNLYERLKWHEMDDTV